MKISEVTIEDLKEYSNIYFDEDPKNLKMILESVKAYIIGYTGLTIDKLDTKEDITMALFILANDLYDNRSFTVENDKINPVIESILNMHCINLL